VAVFDYEPLKAKTGQCLKQIEEQWELKKILKYIV
jgi:hypothetical protein